MGGTQSYQIVAIAGMLILGVVSLFGLFVVIRVGSGVAGEEQQLSESLDRLAGKIDRLIAENKQLKARVAELESGFAELESGGKL